MVSPEKAVIEDLGSRNGTRVNDALIDRPVELKNGDRVGVGPAVLVFCVAGSSGMHVGGDRSCTRLGRVIATHATVHWNTARVL